MDVTINILLWLHLLALGLGGVATFGVPVIGSQIAGATVEARPLLFLLARRMAMVGRGAFVVLIITGPLIVWLKFGGAAGFNFWFGLKMLFVLVLLAVLIAGGIFSKRAENGDRAAAAMLPRISIVGMAAFALIVLSAVFAFN
jgi:putative membrane protein